MNIYHSGGKCFFQKNVDMTLQLEQSDKLKTSSLEVEDNQKSIVSKATNVTSNDNINNSFFNKNSLEEAFSTLDLDQNFDKSNNMQSLTKLKDGLSTRKRSHNVKNKKYNQRMNLNCGYDNDDIVEENENSTPDSCGLSSSGIDGGSGGTNKDLGLFSYRSLLKELPAIPKTTKTLNDNKIRLRKNKRIEELNDIIMELRSVVNRGNPRDKYRYIRQIAKGKNGCIVCSAKNTINGEDVAIKMQQIDDIDNAKYLKLELTILNDKEHSNLIKYYDSYLVSKDYRLELWIVMERIEGGPLHYLIEEVDLLEEDIKIISKEILKGLEFLHENKIIHRDIKSNNILFSKNGEIKIIDFGLSAQLRYLDEKKNSNVGNDYYKSPELLRGDSYSNKIDIWSFGILVYEMTLGRPPNFDNTKRYAAEMTLRNKRHELAVRASDDLLDFYNKCVDHSERRPSASELLKHKFLKSTAPTCSLIPKMREALKQKRREHMRKASWLC